MKKNSLKIITLVSASFIATSCSLFETFKYNWLTATNNNTEIRYCLLIGQNEHSDSIERTRYTREYLGTRDEKTEINGNANLGTPKIGEITLPGNIMTNVAPKKFKVTELEHMEQKSLAGVVWDPITANTTTATWINKHGKKLTMIVSNNDGMAEGAMHAYNYVDKLPIFGYDANKTTLDLINECRTTSSGIMGTVDQNAGPQTAAAFMIIRNILDDQLAKKEGKEDHGIGTTAYDPTSYGFSEDSPNNRLGMYIKGWKGEHDIGIVNPNGKDEHERSPNNMDLSKTDGNHEILSTSTAMDLTNVQDYLNEDGSAKGPNDLAWDEKLGFVKKLDTYQKPTKEWEVCHVYNNAAEEYLQGTMAPYYEQFTGHGKDKSGKEIPAFGIKDNKIDGNGIDEEAIFTQLKPYLSKQTFDAFLINMVTTADAATFIDTIAPYVAQKEKKTYKSKGWDNWEDRFDTPLLFWNKQPRDPIGNVDTSVMNNKFFKYTYFVGVDAAYGGKVQGQMILDYLNRCYVNSMKEAKGK